MRRKGSRGHMSRVSWDSYFMKIAEFAKERSTCIRRQVGAVIVRDNRILSTGYNGAPSGCSHCTNDGRCMRETLEIPSGERHEICRAVHAEQNAIAQAAYSGVSVKDSTIYITCKPCSMCSKLIINAGIARIVFDGDYPDDFSLSFLEEARVRVVKLNDEKLIGDWCRELDIKILNYDGFDREDLNLFERKFNKIDFLTGVARCTHVKVRPDMYFELQELKGENQDG